MSVLGSPSRRPVSPGGGGSDETPLARLRFGDIVDSRDAGWARARADGRIFGVSSTYLYLLDLNSGTRQRIGEPHGIAKANALAFGPDGTLYAAGEGRPALYAINTASGMATYLGGMGYNSAGDLAFNGGYLYLSVTVGPNGGLVRTDPTVRPFSHEWAGYFGFGISIIDGLASAEDGVLYGVEREGSGTDQNIYSIDTATGSATRISGYSGSLPNGATETSTPFTSGACCHPDGTCAVTPRYGCAEPAIWMGAGIPCSPNPCNQVSLGVWRNVQVSGGTPEVLTFSVPAGLPRVFVLLKKTTRVGYADTWDGSLKVSLGGNQLALTSGGPDLAIQVEAPEAGLYQLEIGSLRSGAGRILITDNLPTLTLGEWSVHEVLRPYGSDWTQLDIAPGTESITLQTEGVGLHSRLEVYRSSLAQPEGYWRFGEGYSVKGTIASPTPGRFYLRYTDSAVMLETGGDQNRQYMIVADVQESPPAPCTGLSIESLSTLVGSNTGTIDMTITGTCLDATSVVTLEREGFESRAATFAAADPAERQLNTRLDLRDLEAGEWTLTVQNTHGRVQYAAPLRIERGAPDGWIEIIGREQMRVGRRNHLVIRCGNRGSAPIGAGAISLIVPGICRVDIDDVNTSDPEWGSINSYESNDDMKLWILLGGLQPGSTRSVSLWITPHERGAGELSVELLDSGPLLPTNPAAREQNALAQVSGSSDLCYPKDNMDPPAGSLLFFEGSGLAGLGHIGVSLGNGRFIHLALEPCTGHGPINIRIERLDHPCNSETFMGSLNLGLSDNANAIEKLNTAADLAVTEGFQGVYNAFPFRDDQ